MSTTNTTDLTTLYCADCETYVHPPNIRRHYDRPTHRGCGVELDRVPLGDSR